MFNKGQYWDQFCFWDLYINSIFKINGEELLSCADDTALVITGKSWEKVHLNVESGLLNINIQLNNNKININIDKTKFKSFTPNQITQPNMHIKLHTPERKSLNVNCPLIQKVTVIIIHTHLGGAYHSTQRKFQWTQNYSKLSFIKVSDIPQTYFIQKPRCLQFDKYMHIKSFEKRISIKIIVPQLIAQQQ